MLRKLSTLEHLIEGNICYTLRLCGAFSEARLRQAAALVQGRHPALRALIRQRPDGLYYQDDAAPAVPLSIVNDDSDEAEARERRAMLVAEFPHELPQWRLVWLAGSEEQVLLVAASHRICDGMSMQIIVRELLRGLYRDKLAAGYPPLTPRDVIGDFRPAAPIRRHLAASILNGLLGLLPSSRQPLINREHYLEWVIDDIGSKALLRRCKAESVSTHAALLVALDQALLTVLGRARLPKWIESPVDGRRGRLAVLKDDMLFFGGGGIRTRSGQLSELDFWQRARELSRTLRQQIEQETQGIPNRYHFCEMLRPLTAGQLRSFVRLGDALKLNGSWNRFTLSNLGPVNVLDADAPFALRDLRIHVHSLNMRMLGIIAYALDGRMRFCYMGDEKCLSAVEGAALCCEMMAALTRQIGPPTQAQDQTVTTPRLTAQVAQV